MDTTIGAPRPASLSLHLSEVTSEDVLAKIYRLRVDAWRTKIKIPPSVIEWYDSFEGIARHWAFFDGEKPVAASRLTVSEDLSQVPDSEIYKEVFPSDPIGPIASLTRLVVDPAYRGLGLARQLDAIRIDAAKKEGCSCVIVATHDPYRVRQIQDVGFDIYAPRHPNTEQAGILVGTLPCAIGLLHIPGVGLSLASVR